ncbi:MAG: hypothetical protein HZA50_16885 [Planctomycetes bacterium]|nr:hypothetical protein [Planctomycetota bacterium]
MADILHVLCGFDTKHPTNMAHLQTMPASGEDMRALYAALIFSGLSALLAAVAAFAALL